MCGGVPTGSVETKNDDCNHARALGDSSALARACVRGDARTAAFLLHAAPNIAPVPDGRTYAMHRFGTDRASVAKWAADALAAASPVVAVEGAVYQAAVPISAITKQPSEV